MATANTLISALSRAYDLASTRSGTDPELAEALDEVREIHREMGWVVIRIGDGGFTVLDETFQAGDGDLARFRDALEGARLSEIRLQEVMEPEVLADFLTRIRASSAQEEPSGPRNFRGLEEAVGLSFMEASDSLTGLVGSIQELFPAREAEEEASPEAESPEAESPEAESPETASTEVGTVADPEPGAASTGGFETPPEPVPHDPSLSIPGVDVDGYLAAPAAERASLKEGILAAAAGLREERDNASLMGLVEALAAPHGAESDADAQALAREILTPSIASHLVARLGEIRSEEDRARMIGVCSGLGREMALALADALGEARDRYQRRSFMDAMMAQGPLALEVAKGMVEDPRWFVVRNGESILGEMGGEEAVSHLTGSLANADARVRRETVLALAKLGGKDAEQLLLGMLADQEAEVRAMACRAVGVLVVEKALKPLLEILAEDPSEDVVVECLQALGKIGDPGAVPLIEKRAVRGLFSRPSKEIRISAYRALAGIGTPHAKELLQKAASDSDVSVRTVVQSLLSREKPEEAP